MSPKGLLRFQYPLRQAKTLPVDVYDATYARSACVQPSSGLFATSLSKSEDCLNLNIWVPVSDDQDLLLFKRSSKLYSKNLAKLKYITNGFLYSSKKQFIDINEKKTTLFWIHGGNRK